MRAVFLEGHRFISDTSVTVHKSRWPIRNPLFSYRNYTYGATAQRSPEKASGLHVRAGLAIAVTASCRITVSTVA